MALRRQHALAPSLQPEKRAICLRELLRGAGRRHAHHEHIGGLEVDPLLRVDVVVRGRGGR
eukprot:4006443-Heterocapsa_arctica.AAC.1